jgi:hypothetical protein
MTCIELRSRVGPDGMLTLRIPVGTAEANQEVIVSVRSAANKSRATADATDWKRFVDETAGRWQGEPLVRPEQGEFEKRKEWA